MTRAFVLLIISFFFMSTAVKAEINENTLREIDQLIEVGDYQRALEKHIWFHEASRESPGMGGVRLSYALSSWVELGELYPVALFELRKLRDNYKTVLLAGHGTFNDFHDLSSINRVLKESDQTVELFRYLDKKYPEQAKQYHAVTEPHLMALKEYELIAKYIGDPVFKYESLRHLRELNINMAKSYPELNDPDHLRYADKAYITGVLNLLEVLTALDRSDDKRRVLYRASNYFGYDTITEHY